MWYIREVHVGGAFELQCLTLQELVRDHTHMAVDYLAELEEWQSHDYYDEHVHKIQLPFSNVSIACTLNSTCNILSRPW